MSQRSILDFLLYLFNISGLAECLNRANSRLSVGDTNLGATGRTVIEFDAAMNLDFRNLKMALS